MEGNGRNIILRHYLDIFLERLRKTTKTPSQDKRSPGRDLNLGPPEFEAGMGKCSWYMLEQVIHIITTVLLSVNNKPIPS
jgi:hypothetical protein